LVISDTIGDILAEALEKLTPKNGINTNADNNTDIM
jgi:hypothetical protein